MKKIVILLIVAGVFGVLGCAGSRAVQYGTIGAAAGTGLGYAIGGGKGAIVGGLLGGAAGATVGTIRDERSPEVARGPTPLPWLAGARVLIRSNGWNANDLVRAIVEEGLRQRGAIIVIADNYRQPAGVVYVAEVQIGQEGYCAFVQIRIIERSSSTLTASGFGTAEFYYDGSDRYRSYQWAASRALINLH